MFGRVYSFLVSTTGNHLCEGLPVNTRLGGRPKDSGPEQSRKSHPSRVTKCSWKSPWTVNRKGPWTTLPTRNLVDVRDEKFLSFGEIEHIRIVFTLVSRWSWNHDSF